MTEKITEKLSVPLSDDQVMALVHPYFTNRHVQGQYVTRFMLTFLILICSRAPWFISSAMGGCLGRLACLLKVRKNVAIRNLDLAFGDKKTPAEKDKIYRDSLHNLGHVLINYLRVPRLDKKFWSQNCTWVNREVINRAYARGKGVLFVAGHFGMYDLCGGMIACSGYPFFAVGKTIKNPAVNRFIHTARQRFNLETIPNKDTMQHIIDLLGRGFGVGMVLDQDMPRHRGVFVDWFGHPASTVRSSAYVARKTGCAVIPVSFYQVQTGRFEMMVGEEIQWLDHPQDREEEMRLNTEEHCKAIQRWIYEKPELWFWIHKRYKTQPDPEYDPYRPQNTKHA
jgi:KDO2-lipid IV(A) lauroyltransferase